MGAASAVCAWHGWQVAFVGITTVLLVAGFFLGVVWRSGSLVWAGLCGFVLAIGGNVELLEYVAVKDGAILRNVKIADFVADAKASGATLVDSHVRVDLDGNHYEDGGPDAGAGTWHHAAPVVDSAWTVTEPVAVWAVCPGVGKCTSLWDLPFSAVLKIHPDNEPKFKAVLEATRTRALILPDNPVLVEWVESPESSRQERLDGFWNTVLALNIVWIVGLICHRLSLYIWPNWPSRLFQCSSA